GLILSASNVLPLYHVRYTYIFAAAFYVVVAAGLLFVARRSIVLLALLLGVYLGGSLYAEIHRRSDPAYAKDDYRTAVGFISDRIRPGDAVLVNAGYIYPAFTYYFKNEIGWRGRLIDYSGSSDPSSIIVAETGSLKATPSLGW